MMAKLEVIKNNLNIWNLKVQRLKEQQDITKNYLTTSIINLRITNEHLQKMEIFMADGISNPDFINEMIAQYEKEQLNNSFCVKGLDQSPLPFMKPNLKLQSKNPNLSFVYKLFDTVTDDTNSITLWSKSGTSFFIKDTEGLQNHVQEIFGHNIKTFHKTLSEFGFKCVDRFLQEYSNENFQRDKKHMLKNMKSKRKLLAVKKNMQRDMEEEMKRLKFFLNALKVNTANMKGRKEITKYDFRRIKMFIESASKRIAQKETERRAGLPTVACQPQADGEKKLEDDQPKEHVPKGTQKLGDREGERQPWLYPIRVKVNADTGKLEQDLYKLNVQILKLEQEHVLIEDQLASIEEILPGIERKQQKVELSMNQLFGNPKAIPRKQSRKNKYNEQVENVNKQPRACDESPKQTMNETDHSTNWEDIALTQDVDKELMLFVGILEEELTFSY